MTFLKSCLIFCSQGAYTADHTRLQGSADTPFKDAAAASYTTPSRGDALAGSDGGIVAWWIPSPDAESKAESKEAENEVATSEVAETKVGEREVRAYEDQYARYMRGKTTVIHHMIRRVEKHQMPLPPVGGKRKYSDCIAEAALKQFEEIRKDILARIEPHAEMGFFLDDFIRFTSCYIFWREPGYRNKPVIPKMHPMWTEEDCANVGHMSKQLDSLMTLIADPEYQAFILRWAKEHDEVIVQVKTVADNAEVYMNIIFYCMYITLTLCFLCSALRTHTRFLRSDSNSSRRRTIAKLTNLQRRTTLRCGLSLTRRQLFAPSIWRRRRSVAVP